MNKHTIVAVALSAGVAVSVLAPTAAQAAVPAKYKNCATLNKSYPHGVGRKGAHDKTKGKPVTTFRADTAEFNRAMKANKGLDGDKDGIACEKR